MEACSVHDFLDFIKIKTPLTHSKFNKIFDFFMNEKNKINNPILFQTSILTNFI